MIVPTRLLRTKWPPNPGLMQGDEQFDDLLEDIRRDGIRQPIIVDLEWFVVDGHHRLEIAKLLGIERVDVRIWTTREFVD